MESDYLTPDEAARELSLQTAATVYRRIRAGGLRAELVGGRYRIPRSEVERLKRQVAHKRSSPSFVQRDRESRRAAIRERFAPLPVGGSSS